MKTMCPPGYHHSGFVATHALGHMMYIYKYMHIYKYIYIFPYEKCYQHRLLKYRRCIFTYQIYKAKLKNKLTPSRKNTQSFSYCIIFLLSSKLSDLRP